MKLEKASFIRQQQIESRQQTAQDSQRKHYTDVSQRQAQQSEAKKVQTQQRLEAAETRRNNLITERRGRAKEMQEQFLIKEVAELRRQERSVSVPRPNFSKTFDWELVRHELLKRGKKSATLIIIYIMNTVTLILIKSILHTLVHYDRLISKFWSFAVISPHN